MRLVSKFENSIGQSHGVEIPPVSRCDTLGACVICLSLSMNLYNDLSYSATFKGNAILKAAHLNFNYQQLQKLSARPAFGHSNQYLTTAASREKPRNSLTSSFFRGAHRTSRFSAFNSYDPMYWAVNKAKFRGQDLSLHRLHCLIVVKGTLSL